MNYLKLKEEPLKNSIRDDYFHNYRYTQLGNIDFVIAAKNIVKNGIPSLFEELDFDNSVTSILWAEAKQGNSEDIYESFVQLILTIGKEKTFEKYIPPKYIGAMDGEKIAFIEYHEIQHIFVMNDFNWNVTPSNHNTKEFKLLYNLSKSILEENTILFYFSTDAAELKEFIKLNFKTLHDNNEKIAVTKNNFTYVYNRWAKVVKPTISVNWDLINKSNIISADFFLADLLSENGESIKDSLYVVLKKTKYQFDKKINALGLETIVSVGFTDNQKAYKQFWAIYERPPKEEYWNYIIERRDLLVPQDIRERKGSFFTPQIWVEKSQEYLAEVLGETWQDDYYIWDCCSGTGNLLNGLTNYNNVWASTLDNQDIDIMKDRINNGWKMPENHIFQFDFLNDDFSKCPEELQKIINNKEQRKKLVIYINPPYAEGDNRKGEGRSGVAATKIQSEYGDLIGYAKRELFIQFMARIYKELPDCILGQFSTLKVLQAPKFDQFRKFYLADLKKSFLVPADTFDNVKGQFPIVFNIWDTSIHNSFTGIMAQVFDSSGNKLPDKWLENIDGKKFINDWVETFIESDKIFEKENSIANIIGVANDYQHQNTVVIENPNKEWNHQFQWQITKNNLLQSAIYLAVRWNKPAIWLNDRDQFFFPNEKWKKDKTFQSDCLITTIFHTQNRLTSTNCINHWIPFTREQVGSKKTFKSTFMSDYLNGKIEITIPGTLREQEKKIVEKIELSKEAQAVYDSGLELWKYYHSQPNINENASFYDIRKYFQGENKGRMNTKSEDQHYNELITDLRLKLKKLAKKIEPKIYKYEFLK